MQHIGLTQAETATGMAYEARILAAITMHEEAMRARDLYIDSLRVRYGAPKQHGWIMPDWAAGFVIEDGEGHTHGEQNDQ